ncbi:Autophagy-related protein 9 [Dissostichus eleginoides]|uniref:Autophagy-related protein 9 n=1 Tax=Dissostichus eleginoides TaxID=100907 RepID=A0AAD9C2L9_DISEL|nr:Autophagy-related protein 9 [Dissostichus eleginoides]
MKSNNPVSQVRDTHRESTVIEYIHQPNVMPCVCCPSGGDGLAKLCRLGSGTAGAEERRSGTPRALAVGEGSVGDRDRLAAFGHSVEDTPMAMEKVSSDPHGISNLTGLRCPANPEVGCCVQGANTDIAT